MTEARQLLRIVYKIRVMVLFVRERVRKRASDRSKFIRRNEIKGLFFEVFTSKIAVDVSLSATNTIR